MQRFCSEPLPRSGLGSYQGWLVQNMGLEQTFYFGVLVKVCYCLLEIIPGVFLLIFTQFILFRQNRTRTLQTAARSRAARKKRLPDLPCIREFTDAHNWLELLRSTGGRPCAAVDPTLTVQTIFLSSL